ncbi:ASCH/PUA domain-containing protein [Listeria kieliensis]
MTNTHELKILPQFFKEAKNGRKYFEIRKNDRDYHIGDYVILNEFDGGNYTGRKITGKITFITDFEQKNGYVVFGWRSVRLLQWGDFGTCEVASK